MSRLNSICRRSRPVSAGPRRPHERVSLGDVAGGFIREMPTLARDGRAAPEKRIAVEGREFTLGDGDVVIAAITSCTNTSNPANMITAGLLARNAVARGLTVKPWVKTSFAPGSKVVAEYLERAGLSRPLDTLGFQLVAYGCTTCNGNSGPLAPAIESAIKTGELVSVAVLSGNRNFEGRVHPFARAAYLASPPLVIAYAIAGNITRDLVNEPVGTDANGKAVYLRELWPSADEVAEVLASCLTPELYRASYEHLFEGAPEWRALRGRDQRAFSVACRQHVSAPAAVLRCGAACAGGPWRSHRPAAAGDPRRHDYHRPSGAGRTHRRRQSGGTLSQGMRSRLERISQLRHPARQSRSGDARDPRIAATEKCNGARHARVEIHALQPDGSVLAIYDAAEVYRRRGVPLIVDRRTRIRRGFVARLGGKGAGAARRARGGGGKFRAHSSLESDRHGRAAAEVQNGAMQRVESRRQ